MPIDWNGELIQSTDYAIYNKGKLVHSISEISDSYQEDVNKIYSPITYSILRKFSDTDDVQFPLMPDTTFNMVSDFDALRDELGIAIAYNDEGQRVDKNGYVYKTDADGNFDPYDEFGNAIVYNTNGEKVFVDSEFGGIVWEYDEHGLQVSVQSYGIIDKNGLLVTYNDDGVRYLDSTTLYSDRNDNYGLWYFDDDDELIYDFGDEVDPWYVDFTQFDSVSGANTYDISFYRNSTGTTEHNFAVSLDEGNKFGSMTPTDTYPAPNYIQISSTSININMDLDGGIEYPTLLMTFNDTGDTFKLYATEEISDEIMFNSSVYPYTYSQWGMSEELYKLLEDTYPTENIEFLSKTLSVTLEFLDE